MGSSPSTTAADPVQQIMQMGMGSIVASALHAAVKCKVADRLARGALSADELARAANVNPDALYRCLRALSTTGIFTEMPEKHFANTPASEVLRSDHPAHAYEMVLWMTNRFHFLAQAEFMHSVRTGETCCEVAVKKSCFEYLPTDPETNGEFNDAMTSLSAMVIPTILETYDFSGLGTLCDVAGGHGMVLTSILKRHPDLKGILFDLDHVISGAKPRIEQAGLTSRCTTETGDFFQAVPAADSYVMKHIIHDWDDDKAATILRNCVKAMRGNGKIILIESVVPGPNLPSFAKWLDLEMLTLPGGRERTEEQFRELFASAGLKLNRIVPNQSPLYVLEAVRA